MAAPRKIKSLIVDIIRYSDDITLFKLETEMNCRFRAGQFLHLTTERYHPGQFWPESRVFSIIGKSGTNKIEILVSPKGRYTQSMVKNLKLGDEVWLKLPFGDFSFNSASEKNIVLIAGGTGISPFVTYLGELAEKTPQNKPVLLYYGVKNAKLIIFNNLLHKLINKQPEFKLFLFLETGVSNDFSNTQNGLIDFESIVVNKKISADTLFYVSGPKIMMEKAIATLKNANFDNSQILYDQWE